MTDNLEFVQRELLNCLATCHAISEVHDQYIGDPLDIKMFEYTKWKLEEPRDSHYLAVVHPGNSSGPAVCISFSYLKYFQKLM